MTHDADPTPQPPTYVTFDDSPPDPAAYLALYESTGWNAVRHLTQEQLARAVAGGWYIVNAYHGDVLVGSGRLVADGAKHALITELMILPEYQGMGIGSAILKRLVERCHVAGIGEIQLFAAPGKGGFYERHGFVRRRDDAPGMEWRGGPW